jgi:hypothetical protein
MKTWIASCLLTSLVLATRIAPAQDQVVPGPGPVHASDGQLPEPLSAAPPPDPARPSWGSFMNPFPTPIAPRTTEYKVIGPPAGIVQDVEDQDYNVTLSEPTTILDFDRSIGQVIDLYRPDGMAPVGVFGDHTLPVGTFHVSYRYLQNSYDQNYVGSHRVSTGSIAGQYPYAPANGVSNSQVALIEYGVTRDLTMLAYLPFQHNEINSVTSTGDYKASYTNPGDIRIMGLYVLNRGVASQSHLNFGLSLPVGMLETGTEAPLQTAPNLPYQLRTSSGTYDVLLGYTYRRQTDRWTWGSQINAVVPTGKNTLGYENGNQLQITSWLSRRWTERWSTSGRIDAHFIGGMRCEDSRLNTALSPVNLSTAQGGNYLNGLLGLNYYLGRPENRIFEQRLYLEAGVPFYQSLNGPQLGVSWLLNAGWGMSF